jgi:hypothetical protein
VVRFFEFIRAFGCERDRSAAANLLTRDEARRIDAANIVKLPELPPAVVWVSCSGKFQTQPLTFATDGRAQIRGNDKRSTTAGSARPNCAYGYRNYALISSSVKPPSFVQIAGYCAPRLCCQALPTLWFSEWRTTGKLQRMCVISDRPNLTGCESERT